VFVISFPVSEKLNAGPESIQIKITKNAIENEAQLPANTVALCAKLSSLSIILKLILFSYQFLFVSFN